MSKELEAFLQYLKENIDEVKHETYNESDLGNSLEEAKYIGRVRCLQAIDDQLKNIPELK